MLQNTLCGWVGAHMHVRARVCVCDLRDVEKYGTARQTTGDNVMQCMCDN
jgi:hypothetical protein